MMKTINTMIKPITQSGGQFAESIRPCSIAKRAAKCLGVPIERITGPGHSDDKLMVIWLDSMMSGADGRSSTQLAAKYQIPVDEMIRRLSEMLDRIRREPHLKILIEKLQREFIDYPQTFNCN